MATSTIKDKNIVCSGALFYARTTKRFLFLERTKTKTAGQWGLGKTPTIKKVIPLEMFTSNDSKFHFHTYLAIIDNEFIPTLNDEHSGYAWTNVNCWPKPLHVGLRNTLQNRVIKDKLQTVLDLIV
jgi:hypothetical protein